MKTEIFETKALFLQRADKSLNGVSPQFAKDHPDYISDNATNRGCWNCANCSNCWNCSDCSNCWNCWNCSDCSNCWNCLGCWNCSDCSDLSESTGKSSTISPDEIPVIPNIHSAVKDAVTAEGNTLYMDAWHKCDTTHCRAGWVTTLAGEQGKALEAKTSTAFAAMQIYKKSSNIKVTFPRFFESDEEAMADIVRCAKLEKEQDESKSD